MTSFLPFQPVASRLIPLQRLVKILVSGMAILLLTGGVPLKAGMPELGQEQLTVRLADSGSGLRGFIQSIEQSMISGEMTPVEELIDQEAILHRATGRVVLRGGDTLKALFGDSTRQAWAQRGLTRDFAGTNFRFLRIRSFKNRAGLLFRSAGGSKTLEFYSFVLAEPAPGKYRITDIYTLGVNEYTSETLNRSFLHLAASAMGEAGRALSPDKGAFADCLEEIATISQRLQASEYREVLDACASLPAVVRNDRAVLLMRLQAAEQYSITSRAEVLEDWLKAFPDEMELPLKLSDHYFTQERWDDAERVVNRLIEYTGGDARLMMQLGNINYHRKREYQRLQASSRLP